MQDVERKEIARELHDEIGPHLFALRAHVSSLVRTAESRDPDLEAVRKHGSAIWEQVNALQHFNRRVLEKLRPVGLAELGLREALAALCGSGAKRVPTSLSKPRFLRHLARPERPPI